MPYKAHPGKYRHRVQLQRQGTPVRNNLGEVTTPFATFVSRYASVEAITGREPWYSDQISPDVTHKIEFRSCQRLGSRLGPANRIQWGQRIFNIDSVINPGERMQGTVMIALCKEQIGSA